MIILFVILSVVMLISYAVHLQSARERDRQAMNQRYEEPPMKGIYISMQPVRTVYDSQQRVYREEVISDTSNGRKIDGHSLQTREDWERWSVYDHQARDAEDEINRCIKKLSSQYCDDPDETYALAVRKYREYESLCSIYGRWNALIQDHDVYVPTMEQRQRSAKFLSNIASMVDAAKEKKDGVMKIQKIVLDYLQSCPGNISYRTDAVRKLSSEMDITPSESSKLIRFLYNKGMIREEKNEKGRIIIRKARKKSSSKNEINTMK